jgi:hypothetical protein
MLMVIFGAGASFDSYSPMPARADLSTRGQFTNFPWHRPPLASELFSSIHEFHKLTEQYPMCRGVLPRLRSPHKSLEEELQELSQDGRPDRSKQMASIQYYLRDLIDQCVREWTRIVTQGATNYDALIDEIFGDPCCLVTFNYDTMLDEALGARNLKFSQINDYIGNEIKLFKLHGSVDWVNQVEYVGNRYFDVHRVIEPTEENMIHYADDFKPTSAFHLRGQNPEAHLRLSPYIVPALAIPRAAKPAFMCPPAHLDILGARLRDVTMIVTIGWRGMEQRFMELLKTHLTRKVRVLAVSGSIDYSQQTLNKFTEANIDCELAPPYDGGFTKFVVGRAIRPFLDGLLRTAT